MDWEMTVYMVNLDGIIEASFPLLAPVAGLVYISAPGQKKRFGSVEPSLAALIRAALNYWSPTSTKNKSHSECIIHYGIYWHILHNLIQCNAKRPSVAFVE